ncbi:GPCR, rhodopsin-like, 7TM domain and 7TM GPCR, serpentine receptor class v (Srv) family-containing protein [Strongyloides ratti]|uniref:GPCR, rhodopsin-like, 7TM domain and 7TM GPCR, serpentine receptor class v (Srv) family-containing protein n=1 Tax=Strongyloides ratti TaxID=34506 RepID=A0A090N0X0_STRRB|nr:GPCR, rhodopsin-like, 7TM domain and 7TM GPCR, serpentine receptor class v (Srv) family-containing protein [Strongyloides ratti]CEF71423.1 GPCR, rhodopsin-like, 7TM domain and 7TM GPCR, serpentine receptor class v (Srv) family-containing protein [Strongyloides ratti]
MFLSSYFSHSLVLSVIRYLAVKYPTKYHRIVNVKMTIKVILGMIIFDLIIALGTLFFPSSYKYFSKSNSIIASYDTQNVAYYILFYGVIINGIIVITSLFLNILNWYIIYKKKNKKLIKNRTDVLFAVYTFIVFVSTLLYHIFYILRTIGSLDGYHRYDEFASIFLSYVVEIISFTDFYFLLIMSNELRKGVVKFTFSLFRKDITKVTLL